MIKERLKDYHYNIRKTIASFIYRPPRTTYSSDQVPRNIFLSNGDYIKGLEIEVKNNRNQTIKGTFYQSNEKADGNPCVIYLHGNASSQMEGNFLTYYFLPIGVNVLCVDLTGSGNSDGETIGLGITERDDVENCIRFIRSQFNVIKVVLWGRSMGAAIAAWYSSEHIYDITAIVSDSPYLSVKDIVDDAVGSSWFLWILSRLGMAWINPCVKNYGNFELKDVNITRNLTEAVAPALFIHAVADKFINCRESRELFNMYGSKEKYLLTTPGSHNSHRPDYILEIAVNFVKLTLGINKEFEFEHHEFQNDTAPHFSDISSMIRNRK